MISTKGAQKPAQKAEEKKEPGIGFKKKALASNVQKPVKMNFMNDMKKHGMMKEIEGVKDFKQFLENSPVDGQRAQSPTDNPKPVVGQFGDDPLPEQESTEVREEKSKKRYHSPTLQSNQYLVKAKDIKKANSPGNEQKVDQKKVYIFPFQRRARSLSPPKDGDQSAGDCASDGSAGINSNGFGSDDGMRERAGLKIKGSSNQKKGPVVADRKMPSNLAKAKAG